MPRYEFTQGSSNKYWEITLQSHAVITHYGRIGTDGQSTTKTFKSEAEAKSAYDKLIAEKTKNGYELKAGAVVAEEKPPEIASSNPLIDRLDRWMNQNRKYYYIHLNPGAVAEEIEKFETRLGRKFPQTLKDFLLRKNGADGKGPDETFIDAYRVMSLAEVIDAWGAMRENKAPDDFKGKCWNDESWVPFLENGDGDFLCVDLDGKLGKPGAVIEFWHDADARKVWFESIDEMFKQYLDALESDSWAIDDDGHLRWKDDPAVDGDGEDEDEEENDKRPAKVQGEPTAVKPFMQTDYPKIVTELQKMLGSDKPVELIFDRCDKDTALFLTRALRQAGETLRFWNGVRADLVKKIKRVIVRADERTRAKLVDGELDITLDNDEEFDGEDVENNIDKAICDELSLPRLQVQVKALQKGIDVINGESRLNLKIELVWADFIFSGADLSGIDNSLLYHLRSLSLNNEDFRRRLRQAVRCIRVECSTKKSELVADGPDLVFRFCDKAQPGYEFGDVLLATVMKMKPMAKTAAPAGTEKFVPSQPPAASKALLKAMAETRDAICETLGSLVEFEVDWSGFAAKEIELDDLDKHGSAAVGRAFSRICEKSEEKKTLAKDRVRYVRFCPAASEAEKSLTASGSTVIYRLLPDRSEGCFADNIVAEAIEELAETMPKKAPVAQAVAAEMERIEKELNEIRETFAQEFESDVPFELDRTAIGNNLLAAREIDTAVLSSAIQQLAKKKDSRSALLTFASRLSKVTIRPVEGDGYDSSEFANNELIFTLPALSANISGLIRGQLREIEEEERQREHEKHQAEQEASMGPQFIENFKMMKETTMSMDLEGDAKGMAALVTGKDSKKALDCFQNCYSNLWNAMLMGRAEDAKFAKCLEKIKKLRLEVAGGGEKKSLSFDNGLLICVMKMSDGASGTFTEKEFRSQLKKLIGA